MPTQEQRLTDAFQLIGADIKNILNALWTKTGNAGTNPATHFLGTTDAKDLVFKTNNIERVRILSGGNISVINKLTTSTLQITTGSSVNSVLVSDALGNGSWSSLNTLAWRLAGNSGTNPANDFIGTTDNQPLVFRTNNVERFRILGNGNVGIGITNPGSSLDVNGNTWVRGQMFTDTINTFTSVVLTLNGSQGFIMNANGSPAMRLFINGNLAIGSTTDAGFKLDVNGTARLNGNTSIGGGTAGARLDVRAQGALSTDIAFRVRNSADSANLMSIAGNGNLSYNAQGGGISLLNNNGTTDIGSTSGSATRINLLANSNNTININVAGTIGTIFNAARGGASGETAFLFNASIGNLAGTTNYGKIINIKDSRTDLGNRANTVVGLLIQRDSANTNTLLNVQALSATTGNVGFGVLINNASARVQIDSTTQGFLPPRMTNAQRIAIASPAVGLVVYQTDATEGLYVNSSTGWTIL